MRSPDEFPRSVGWLAALVAAVAFALVAHDYWVARGTTAAAPVLLGAVALLVGVVGVGVALGVLSPR